MTKQIQENKIFEIETYCPCFVGFYNTLLSTFDDSYIEQSWDYEYIESKINNPELSNKIHDFIMSNYTDYFNYKELHEAISKQVVNYFNEYNYFSKEVYFKMEFESLYSPKYYNYETDSINVKIQINNMFIEKLKVFISDNIDDFQNFITDRYTSHSGFISHYSNNYKDWLEYLNIETLQNNAHYLGSFLDFYFDNIEQDITDSIYNYCHEYFICNGYIDDYFNYNKMIEDINKAFNIDFESMED